MIFKRARFDDTTFTTLPNTLLRGGGDSASSAREDGLTPEALGVLVYLLSHAAEWQVSQAQLCKVFAVGKTKMQSITKCLEVSGYIKRAPARVASGQFGGYDYLVSDSRDFHGTYKLASPNRETPNCRECDRGGELQKIIPQASFAFSAPRDYQIIRDDARKKT